MPTTTRPYFHDGRYDTYEQVVAQFRIAFSALAIPTRTGTTSSTISTRSANGMQPYQYEDTPSTLKEVNDFALVLGAAIAANDKDVVRGSRVDTIGKRIA